jgi:hypothetical protein
MPTQSSHEGERLVDHVPQGHWKNVLGGIHKEESLDIASGDDSSWASARGAQRYREMAPVLNERSRRRFAALEAQALGRGGISLMARISGLARSTI